MTVVAPDLVLCRCGGTPCQQGLNLATLRNAKLPRGSLWKVICMDCKLQTGWFWHHSYSLCAWNRNEVRKDEPALPQTVSDLVEIKAAR